MSKWPSWIACYLACGLFCCAGWHNRSTVAFAADEIPAASPELRDRCLEVMRGALRNEPRWAKVHAAEFLVGLDYRQGVREVFENELAAHGELAEYRIGIWRVFAQLDRHNQREYQDWIDRILAAFMDKKGPDRVHAIESLAKLGYQFPLPAPGTSTAPKFTQSQLIAKAVRAFAEQGPGNGRAYALWVLLNNGIPDAEQRLAGLLTADEPAARTAAAYALRHLDSVANETRHGLRMAYEQVNPNAPERVYLATALLQHRTPDDEQYDAIADALFELLKNGTPAEQYEITRWLAGAPRADAAPLVALLGRDDVSIDVQSSAAQAICRIARRVVTRMPLLDWLVVGGYGTGMLAVGVYYARRTRTSDDYLLGGRNMRPWAVGLSLFATLLSTLSYLAWPGEMIKNGPLVLMGYAAHPLIFLVVGWLLIPRIMKLEVTSAYEVLEKRLGLSVRLLGSCLFLSLRFLWMASIIYWTTTIVLLPAAGLDAGYAPYFALVLGVITVLYTSLGGIRAVVMTDVIQTFVLFTGAVTALLLITLALGGVGTWFPDHWQPHWTPPQLWFDFSPNARSTLANAMLATFSWYVCTAGSDQMAIQRYLATRDVHAARRTLAISLSSDFLVLIFLGLLGLALLSYFSANPEKLVDGQTVYRNADKLFPRFVVVGLPVGMSGLVIAGLLAAAMSSLSSGVNSSAAVISQDFVRRLRSPEKAGAAGVRLARVTSLVVGLLVVLLSTFIGRIQGNMLEVVYKAVNLFVAPLFFLFFMAIFVPWATAAGTWLGACAAIATAVLIAFWRDVTGVPGISFLWIMPGSLLVGIVVGCLASFLLGGRRPGRIPS